MPFNQLRRQDSFPPTIIHLSPQLTAHHESTPRLAIQDLDSKPLPSVPQQHNEETDIDRNPISFFLTTPTDSHDFGSDEEVDFFLDQDDYPEVFDDDEDLSAGIEGSEEDLLKRDSEVREISPSSLQRQREEEDPMDEVEFGFAMPLSLKDFTSRSVTPITITDSDAGRMSRAGYHPETLRINGLAMNPPSSPPQSQREKNRGRGRVRLSPPIDTHGRSLSWSPGIGSGRRKPVSWRTPSRSIWTIDEDDELHGGQLSSSAPSTGGGHFMMRAGVGLGIGGLKKDDGRQKLVKKVRWADLEEN